MTEDTQPIQTIPYTMQVPKEGKEIVDASSAITKHFINGGSMADAYALLPGVMTAVENAKQTMVEMKSQYKDELAGYSVHKFWDALDKDEVEAAPDQPVAEA